MELKRAIREAYVSHKLNQPELIRVVSDLEKGVPEKELRGTVRHFCEDGVDWRRGGTCMGPRFEGGAARGVSPLRRTNGLDHALETIGLRDQFEALSDDKSWSAYQRAVYRRVSAPQLDPGDSGPRAHSHRQFCKTTSAMFGQLDRDKNGSLSLPEIDAGMAREGWSARQMASLSILRAEFPTLKGQSKDGRQGITRADLRACRQDFHFTLRAHRAAQMQETRPLKDEHFDGREIVQANPASCVLLSTTDQVHGLRDMFSANADGTVTVRFADGSEETVHDLSKAERLYHSRTTRQDRWPGLLEMAVGQKLGARDGTARSGANYVSPVRVAQAMTGKNARYYSINRKSPNEVRTLLQHLLKGDQPVIASSRWIHKPWGPIESLHNGIVNCHAYAVEGYDAGTDTVRLRNPWHRQEWSVRPDGQDDGKFSMPLRDFYASYWLVTGKA